MSERVKVMRVLVACEFSGIVRRAFRARGHDAWSCDLLPAEDGSPFHYQGDVRRLLTSDWGMGIFHPPCTFLANSGVRWLYKGAARNESRWAAMKEAARFFRECLDAPFARIAVENPIMHKHGLELVGSSYSQILQPWQFGHGETKATCLWLNGLPTLKPTNIVEGREHRVHRMPPGASRWKERSRTYTGIALAMADQWGSAEVAATKGDEYD